MNLEEAVAQLERLGDPKIRQQNTKNGAPENQFGVKMGDIRTVAKQIKNDHELGLKLWQTGNLEAMLLATLVVRPKLLTNDDLERMTAEVTYGWLADWLNSYVLKPHPNKEALRLKWMGSDHPMLARAAWSLTTERLSKDPDGIDVAGLLDRIDRELGSAPAPTQWTMNFCLIEIGVNYVEFRQRAIDIGARLGLYSDWPHNKGCIPPYAPVCIPALVARKP